MYKTRKLTLLLMIAISVMMITYCGQTDKKAVNNEASPSIKSDTTVSGTTVQNPKIGEWVQKGVECYGIVIMEMKDKTIGKSVKCKVMIVKPDQVKMKTIEGVSLMESLGCDKIGLSYGDTWWETQGDIFKTREEADNYLKEKGWFIK